MGVLYSTAAFMKLCYPFMKAIYLFIIDEFILVPSDEVHVIYIMSSFVPRYFLLSFAYLHNRTQSSMPNRSHLKCTFTKLSHSLHNIQERSIIILILKYANSSLSKPLKTEHLNNRPFFNQLTTYTFNVSWIAKYIG